MKVFDGAHLAYSKFGLGFIASRAWDPVKGTFGALDLIYGTAVTSLVALLIATPLSIAIGLFLSELAPRGIRDVVGALVEMLAAVPSVIVGLWGILVLGPFVQSSLEPFLHRWLSFLPLFQGKPSRRDPPGDHRAHDHGRPDRREHQPRALPQRSPELKEGALALGMTRWEMVRGVVLPYARPGIAAAVILGLGRAVGEAIAVTQVIGNTLGIHISLFSTGDTLASRIASQYQGASTKIQLSAIVYLAAILLVITLIANVFAQMIVRRFEFQRTGGQ